jgi:hypothetical protein
MPEPVLPRCRVNVRVYGQDGIPEVGARVSATLNTFEVYQGYVVPQRYEGTTDEDGLCVLELFPNELGSVESNYRVKIVGTGGKSLVLSAVVPNLTEADLENCAVLPPFPGKVDGQLALDAVLLVGQQAQQAALDAQQAANEASTSATSAAVSSTAASDSAASAGAAAVSAGNSVTAASGFASSASGFADSAAASASAAASSATNANASAVAAAASLASFDPPTVVRTSGDQTIGGVKTFSSPPVVPAGATGAQAPQAQEVIGRTGATGSAVIPSGTTAQRDGSPAVGYTRFNSTLGKNETWNGTHWVPEGGLLFSGIALSGLTAYDWSSIPPWVNKLGLSYRLLRTSGTSIPIFRIGSGGILSTTYTTDTTILQNVVASTSFTNGLALATSWASTNQHHGSVVVRRVSSTAWAFSGTASRGDITGTVIFGGSVNLSGALTDARLTTVNGTDTYHADAICSLKMEP